MNNEKGFKDLPEGWKWVRLGEVLLYEQPQKYIVLTENYEDKSGIPVLTAGKTFILGFTNENFGICNNLPVILFDDFTTDSRFVNFPFKVKSSATKLLRARDKNIKLFYLFNAMQLIKLKPGSEHKRFWISEYSRLSIPLPPLPEQQKIAEILETIDNAIEKTDKIIEKYKRIKQGLMQDLLTKGIDVNGNIRNEKTHKFKDSPLGRIPKEWEVVRLEEDVILITGSRPKGGAVEEGIPSLGGEHITEDGRIIFTEQNAKYIPDKFFKLMPKGKVEVNDILINKDGANTGKVAILKVKFHPHIAINEHLFILRSKKFFEQKYLFYWLYSSFAQTEIKNRITGSAQPGLSSSFIKNFFLPLPPLDEQQRIAEILSQIDQTIEKEEQYKEKLKRIKQGLMEDLLTGKVRVNNLIKED